MKKLTIAMIIALSIAAFGSVNSYANEATDTISTTVTTEQAQKAEELIQAKLDSGISLEDAITEVLTTNPELLLAVAQYAESKSMDVDVFQGLAIALGIDATKVTEATDQFTAAGPGQGINNGNVGNNQNNGVGQGQGNGRNNNRGNGNGSGGGGGDCGVSETCNT
ncbi:hypothetical protein [Pseudoalteromonas sp. G4]|uniref:hypothetical protein n=1 Tax=Pseudoalteromonas sp. G4 TaxID=2992761 RepID=UPI00237E89F5|nr:hypothetical protein [Pseudoalteromonas sp. G4]MDE3270644.1 hypothetical protein [Pseudoalteromonas sp. G4]